MRFTAPLAASIFAVTAHAALAASPSAPTRVGEALRGELSGPPVGPMVVRAGPPVVVPRAARPYTSIVAVDRHRVAAFARAGGGLMEAVPLSPTVEASLVLEPVNPAEDGATLEVVVHDGRGRSVAEPAPLGGALLDGVYLAGAVAGVEGSHAFLASTAAGTYGYVEMAGRTFIISSGPFGGGLPTVAYELTRMPEGIVDGPAWACETPDPPFAAEAFDGGVAGSDPCRQVRVAYETDAEFLQLFGGDTDAANGYIGTLAAALTSIYARDLNARLSVSYVRLWQNSSDPWTQSSTSAQLSQFATVWNQSMQSVPRDLAHFLSGRALGGGVAYLPGLCGSSPYGLSANLGGYFPSPLVDNNGQNWDIYVVAHEIGHNFGAPHTHAYSPPLDGCGLSPADCSAAEQDVGTIMSYCHLCAGGLTNIKLQFHPGNIATMQGYLASIACDYTGPARAPIAVAASARAPSVASVAIDVLGNDLAFNCEDIVIASTANGGSVLRSSSSGPGGRDQLTYLNSSSFEGVDAFTYTVRDASNQTASATVFVEMTPLRAPENPVNPSPQLDARYYVLSAPTALPQYSAMTPYLTGAVAQVAFNSTSGSFAGSGRSNDVGAVFEGFLSVPAGGEWTLFLSSDDGSRLFVGDTLVVNNDGVHGMLEASGAIALAAGMHALRIEFFEATGGAGLVFSWQGPGVGKQVVPASALFRGGLLTRADINNDGRVDALDVAMLLGAWGTSNADADLDQSGLVTAADMTILLNDWTE
ncbi:MAG: M12 family metallo-peptidase [Phycisphaerales bacterium]